MRRRQVSDFGRARRPAEAPARIAVLARPASAMTRLTIAASIEVSEPSEPVDRSRAGQVMQGQRPRALIESREARRRVVARSNLAQDRRGLIAENRRQIARRHDGVHASAGVAIRGERQRTGVRARPSRARRQ